MVEPLRVLLTNDDGIDAPGLKSLECAFLSKENVEVWVVAPDRERSTCSHGMHLNRPVFAGEVGPRKFKVDGMPVDCVYLAMYGLMPQKPHVVVSGVNAGANLGSDVIFSGTVAGARQAALQGVHGVASSLVGKGAYDSAAEATRDVALAVATMDEERPVVLNLNFPEGRFKGPRFGPLGVREYPRIVTKRVTPLNGQPYYWLGGPPVHSKRIEGTDCWLIENGIASATYLQIDQSAVEDMRELAESTPMIEKIEEK